MIVIFLLKLSAYLKQSFDNSNSNEPCEALFGSGRRDEGEKSSGGYSGAKNSVAPHFGCHPSSKKLSYQIPIEERAQRQSGFFRIKIKILLLKIKKV